MNSELFSRHIRTLVERHDAALAASTFDAVAVHAGSLRYQFLDDAAYPFKPNPLFKAWLPLLAHPECFVVYAPGAKPKLVYFQPEDYWHKPPDDPVGFWTDEFDIEVVRQPERARDHMPSGATALLAEQPDAFADWGFADVNPDALLNPIHFARSVKTDYEVACMREASRLGVLGHRAAAEAFAAGGSEYDIHLAYCKACSHTEEQLPYSNIIALNEHGAVLHYTHMEKQAPEAHRSFLIDAGAGFNGYASDITRTYAAGGGTFAALIESVDSMQQALCNELAPGVDYPALHIDTHRRISGILADSGIVTTGADEAFDSGLTRLFFPHGLGHFIGLQVHDVAGFMADASGTLLPTPEHHPFLRLTRTVAAGQVMTVEPGVYFIRQLLEPERSGSRRSAINWSLVDELYPFGGVRIEDDVLVTDSGSDNLTRNAFAA